ncbi:MAG: hypothetical protein NPIRA01_22180 [Nitrospirales bacterium]|nr:MAG: hypothetical protein NPIRA01_22180 [Nitrospirales bacterium]
MPRHKKKRLRTQIYVHENQSGDHCVPYKTLIGHGIGNRVIIADTGEQVYCDQGFASVNTAVDEAKRRAWATIEKKFPEIDKQEIIWDVVHEQAANVRSKWKRCERPIRHSSKSKTS